MMNSIIKKVPKFARTLIVLAFWVIIWQIIAVKVDSAVLVSSPAEVFKRLIQLMGEKEYYVIISSSVLRILSGFLIAVGIGTILGIITAKVRILDEILSPVLSIIKATPVASFIILALVWLNKETIPSFISFLMVLPIIHGNVCEGLKNTPTDLIEMSRIYNLSFKQKLTKLYLPSILPYFSAGFKTSLGLAWKAGVAAEVLSFPKNSIGKQLYEGKTYLETVDVFAWTLTVIVISVILEFLLMEAFKKLTARKRGANNI
ncbi:MAG: ABC transporter permease subunit, partial [Clostridia bacterium]|nr:ABC transporter permease subunit [Clostridia bacterium]